MPGSQRVCMGGRAAWSVAVINLARPLKAENNLKEAVLGGRCVLSSAQPDQVYSLSFTWHPKVLWAESPKRGTYHSGEKGTSAERVLLRLHVPSSPRVQAEPRYIAPESWGITSLKRESPCSPYMPLREVHQNGLSSIFPNSQGQVECSVVSPQRTVQHLECRRFLIRSSSVLTEEPSIFYD